MSDLARLSVEANRPRRSGAPKRRRSRASEPIARAIALVPNDNLAPEELLLLRLLPQPLGRLADVARAHGLRRHETQATLSALLRLGAARLLTHNGMIIAARRQP